MKRFYSGANISLPPDFVEYLQLLSQGTGMNRSKLVQQLLLQALEDHDALHGQAREAFIAEETRRQLDKLREKIVRSQVVRI